MQVGVDNIMRYRLAVAGITGRRPASLAEGAHAGLQDGSPWSGLLSLHARLGGVDAESWKHPSLAQVFGPRGAVYLVPRDDVGVFTLGASPTDVAHAARTQEDAERVSAFVGRETLPQREVLAALPELEGSRNLRWAGSTGRLLAVWDARDTLVYAAPAPAISLRAARRELARRFFKYLGPATADDLAWWLDGRKRGAEELTESLGHELVAVATDRGEMLVTADTVELLLEPPPATEMTLLPPDDPVINRRTARPWVDGVTARALWPTAPPPGAALANGVAVAAWRRRGNRLTVRPLRSLSRQQEQLIEHLAAGLPMAGDARVDFVPE